MPTPANYMRAQVIHQNGAADEVFSLEDVAIPQAAYGQVLIKVLATSVNPIDCKLRSGAVGKLSFPTILHSDVAGYIVDIGEGVEGFAVGDAVFGNAGTIAGTGALAEYKVADARLIAHAPRSLELAQAAALPLVGITAWEALFDKGNIRPWQQVLIQGGAGGVGHVATQLALWAGCEVSASASAQNKELIEAYGAHFIDYAASDALDKMLEQSGGGFDVVFDTFGRSSLDAAIQAANIQGTVVGIAGRSSHDLSAVHNKALDLKFEFKTANTLNPEKRAHQGWILKQLAKLVDRGKLNVRLDAASYTLAEVAKAHEHMENGRPQGKILIRIA